MFLRKLFGRPRPAAPAPKRRAVDPYADWGNPLAITVQLLDAVPDGQDGQDGREPITAPQSASKPPAKG